MKTLTLTFFLLGIALLSGIMTWLGIEHVVTAMQRIGILGFIAIVGAQILVDVGLGFSWFCACPELGLFRAIASRAVRDAAGNCLPFSQLGGMIIGTRATCSIPSLRCKLEAPHWPAAVASNVVDITTELLGQIVFIIIALACLLHHSGPNKFTWPILIGLAILAAGVTVFIWTQQRGGATLQQVVSICKRHIAETWRSSLTDNMDSFQGRLDQLWARPKLITAGTVLHFFCWVGGAGVTWLSLQFLGAHAGLLGAIAIEGVVCGVMSASFLVPGALGVQEAAYVGIGLFFGISAEISLGLSLLRRGRDIAIGVPVMVIWQILEMRQLRATTRTGSIVPSADYRDSNSPKKAS